MFSRLLKIIKSGDRRKDRRVKTRIPAILDGIKGRIIDIGLGGIGFYPDMPGLKIGDEVMATLRPDPLTEVKIPCRIVGSDTGAMVLCVIFLHMSEENFLIIQDIITHQAIGVGLSGRAIC